ncbi:Uncharacterised protein [Serratia liquefaciens]|nr:Uncharacterised protein [Serratia liquefaciens]CAI2529235.1 Uncharacterised protein [Serratia liquefaciens]
MGIFNQIIPMWRNPSRESFRGPRQCSHIKIKSHGRWLVETNPICLQAQFATQKNLRIAAYQGTVAFQFAEQLTAARRNLPRV